MAERSSPLWRRTRSDPGRDAVLAVGLTAVVLASAATAPPGRVPLDAAGYLLLVLPALSVAARRRLPVPVLALAAVAALAYEVRGYPGVSAALPVMVALYATVSAGHRRAAGIAVGAILVIGVAGENVAADGGALPQDVFQRWFLLIGWMVAASVLAEVFRQHRAYLDQVERRAEDAERTREETARRRADEERLRIARELHDSLTHGISIIKVQVGVAVHLARKRDQPVPDALLAIQEASTEAMRELRATLEVLRDDRDAGSGLDRLPELVDGTRRAGMPVTLTVAGKQGGLPAPVDRAAYRIIQEALTNATRHAGPATVSIHLDYTGEALNVRVEDDGLGSGGDVVPGVGLTGMRERVSALGGSLHAGPRPGGGFTVRAGLPLAHDMTAARA